MDDLSHSLVGGHPAQGSPGATQVPVPANVAAPHILIVEDDPDLNALLAQALGSRYWISRAFDGRDGMRRATQPDRPDLIITDLMMPGTDGASMVDEVRRRKSLEDVPIIVLTALADDALRVQMLRQGIQDYLHKPFSLEELLARVQNVLDERKRIRLRLQRSEEHYRTLFNSIDQGFCVLEMIFDEDGKAVDYRLLETNPAFEQQTGIVDAQGRRVREFAPALEDHWFELYGQVALTGVPMRAEKHAEQLGRWFEVHAFRYGDRENRQVAVLFSDITARKQGEEALREESRRKDQFLALLAHELRNPLAPISTGVRVLRLAGAGSELAAQQMLPMMERQLAHMARLLDDLLDVSRIRRGTIELRREHTDMRTAVHTAIEANRPLIDGKRHALAVSLPDEPLCLDGDPARLAQIVSNLLNNAANYSPPGSRIVLEAGPDGGAVVLRVRDNGAGIASQDLSEIFGMFVQRGDPYAGRQGGLGIGLSLVQVLASMHGGSVEAHSDGLGRGTEFTVRLPGAGQPHRQFAIDEAIRERRT
jgi:PAS domain S-box-containing protein